MTRPKPLILPNPANPEPESKVRNFHTQEQSLVFLQISEDYSDSDDLSLKTYLDSWHQETSLQMTAAVFHANISQLVEALDLASRISILSPCGHETTKRKRSRVQCYNSKEIFLQNHVWTLMKL